MIRRTLQVLRLGLGSQEGNHSGARGAEPRLDKRDVVRVVLGGPSRHCVNVATPAPPTGTDTALLGGARDDDYVDVLLESTGVAHHVGGSGARGDAVWVWLTTATLQTDASGPAKGDSAKATTDHADFVRFQRDAMAAGQTEVLLVLVPLCSSTTTMDDDTGFLVTSNLWRACADASVRHSLRVAELM